MMHGTMNIKNCSGIDLVL